MSEFIYYQTYNLDIHDTDIHLVLHDLGDIKPSNIHDMAIVGFLGNLGRYSNIMPGKDIDGNSCFVMYVVSIKSEKITTDFNKYDNYRHYTGYVVSDVVRFDLFPEEGTEAKLNKYYSYDGLEWKAFPDSPKSIWNTDGTEAILTTARFFLLGLPVPYTNAFGNVFGRGKKPTEEPTP